MSDGYPCPNPTCTHRFPAASVKGADALTCPRCGTAFRFRPAQASTTRPAVPVAKPVLVARPVMKPPAAVPLATPVAPLAKPVPLAPQPPAPADVLAPPEDFTALRLQARRSEHRGWLGVLLATVVVGGLGAAVIYTISHDRSQPPVPQELTAAHVSALYNYRFRFPAGWALDDRVKISLNSNLVVRRTEPNAWLAVFAKDYKDHNPRDGEMLFEAVTWMKGYFQALEWEPREAQPLAGKTAQRLVFTGRVNQVDMTGEVYLFAHQGFAYRLLTWTPTPAEAERDNLERLAQEWGSARAGFEVLQEREGWGEKVARVITATGNKAPYTLKYTEGAWEKRDPLPYDPDADFALLGRDRIATKDADKTATFLVLVLSPQPDLAAAVKAARSHLREKLQQEYQRDPVLEVVKDKAGKPQDGPADLGKVPGHLVKLHFRIPDGSLEKYLVLAVVRRPEHTLVLQAECAWDRRALWEADFQQVLNSVALPE